VQIKSLNESCEAYTGNYAGRKGARTTLKQFSLVKRFRKAVDDPFNARRNPNKGTGKNGEVLEALPGSESVACVERSIRNLGDPCIS
jgi:hypothetical protein